MPATCRRSCVRGLEEGMSLLELMIALAILSIAILGAGSVLVTTTQANFLVREDAAAMRVARAKIAEIKSTDFDDIITDYGSNYTFRAELVDGVSMNLGLEVTGVQQDEGEVVIITDETPDEADYARDLDGNGSADGVDLNSDASRTGAFTVPGPCVFPMDLNCDGDINDNVVAAADMDLIPVVVIIRWRSQGGGTRRVELMTIVGRP